MNRYFLKTQSASLLIILIFQLGVFSMTDNNAATATITETDVRPINRVSFADTTAITIPFELTNNHIYLPVRVNDSELLWFLLDTGAGASIIDLERAKTIGLTLEGQVQTGGAGANAPTGAFVNAATLHIVGLDKFALPLQLAIPFNQLAPYEGRELNGVLGYDFISRYVVEIDYARRQIKLYDPEKFEYSGKGESIPLTFKVNHPHVRASVEQAGRAAPVEGDFVVDLGSRLSVALTKPFVESNNLLQFAGQTIKAPAAGAGVGGESKALVGRLKSLRLGNVVVKKPLASFSQDEKGVFATGQYFEGNIGGEILRRFTVILDYPRSRMILERAANSDAPFEFDTSGIYLIAEGADFKTFKIRYIAENSPASAADLREGDVITSINDHSAAQFSLEEIRQMFKQKGHSCKLAVERGNQKIKTEIKLKKLI